MEAAKSLRRKRSAGNETEIMEFASKVHIFLTFSMKDSINLETFLAY